MNNANDASAAIPSSRSLRIPDYREPLLVALDGFIFLQLGIQYLQDNSALFLILRAVSQVLHVQHRPRPAIQLPPVVLINLFCWATHLISSTPEAKGWASRGYLHGGLIIDIVGETPASKWRLALVDVLILGLQLVMLVVGYEKFKSSGSEAPQETSDPQDLEAAEEGRAGSRAQPQETEEGIELQSLLPASPQEDGAAQDQPTSAASDNDIIQLNMRQGLRALMRRSRVVAAGSPTGTTAESAGIAELLSRIAAARARAA